jgi:hypothetical protein
MGVGELDAKGGNVSDCEIDEVLRRDIRKHGV